MILVLTMLMTMFVGIGAVSASDTYTALSTPTLVTNGGAQDLAIIQVSIPNAAAIKVYDVVTVSLPSEITLAASADTVAAFNAAPGASNVQIVVPASLPNGHTNGLASATTLGVSNTGSAVVTSTRTSIDITMNAGAGTANPGLMLIYMKNAAIGSVEGDVKARMLAPANSGFPSGEVTVGRATVGRGNTLASVLSVKSFGDAGLPFNPGLGQLGTDVISLAETAPATLEAGEVIKVKLPNGFAWTVGAGTQSWGWANGAPTVQVEASDARILNVTVNNPTFPSVAGGQSGRVNFRAGITVDDSIARLGDVTARIYSNKGNVSEQDLVLAKYVQYGVEVKEDTKKDLIAGKHDQTIGNFIMEENIAGSLIGNRMVRMTLPSGVKWSGEYQAGNLPAPPVALTGNVVLGGYSTQDNYSTLRTVVTAGTKSKFKFENLRVDVAPDFTGPITVTFSGEAGVSGEVVVAEVTPAVELQVENISDIRIGEQNQQLGTLVITETKRENIKLVTPRIDVWGQTPSTTPTQDQTTNGAIHLTLPGGAEWSAGYPTVEVTEGDIVLKVNEMSKTNDGRVLVIPVKSESTIASTIKVSGLSATLYRTVPEGAFKVGVTGLAINETGGKIGDRNLAFPQYESLKVTVANCITPAPQDDAYQTNVEFRIDSNIYYVNGKAMVMDVAPYITNGRTFLPIRYVAYALDIDEEDIVWDSAARTVTIYVGDNEVELTIGSTTMYVNGEAVVMDASPEITNDRTMLPIRWVAEAFGNDVGWDPMTRTVLIH